jgi:hypothetical protein
MLPEASARAAVSLLKIFFRYWRKTQCLAGGRRSTTTAAALAVSVRTHRAAATAFTMSP